MTQLTSVRSRHSLLQLGLTSILTVLGIVVYSASAPASTPGTTTTAIASPTPVPMQRRVQVYFPKYPDAESNFAAVAAVTRSTPTAGVARFAIEQLIAGPTQAEQGQGFAPAVRLQGSSTCGGDFQIAIAQQTARLQFCRTVVSNGVGDDARAQSAIQATLRQFTTVNRVVILDANGNCLGDQSGMNQCLSS